MACDVAPDLSEISTTGNVMIILDISAGSDRRGARAVKLMSADSASCQFWYAEWSVEVRCMQFCSVGFYFFP